MPSNDYHHDLHQKMHFWRRVEWVGLVHLVLLPVLWTTIEVDACSVITGWLILALLTGGADYARRVYIDELRKNYNKQQ